MRKIYFHNYTSLKNKLLFLAVLLFLTLNYINASVIDKYTPIKSSNTVQIKSLEINQIYNSRGKLLYENHCTSCHLSQVHIRENHKARNLIELKKWVIYRAKEIKLDWDEDEFNAVTLYLSEQFYKYTKK